MRSAQPATIPEMPSSSPVPPSSSRLANIPPSWKELFGGPLPEDDPYYQSGLSITFVRRTTPSTPKSQPEMQA
jgi:hypothetical protein